MSLALQLSQKFHVTKLTNLTKLTRTWSFWSTWSCKKLPLSAAVFCFRRYSAVHASSLFRRLPNAALSSFPDKSDVPLFMKICQYIFYFVCCAGLQFRVPVLPDPCTSMCLVLKKRQFLFSEPWSIQLLLIEKIVSCNWFDNCR